ncbi:hypothetical protein [Streptomyces cucumeris]|uniref:hypothetical protein n=1 Tax=Streptomyces cucumeris TaxID=2962890 RepID=UPI003D711B74
MTITLARVVQTCRACPSQWDAWTVTGQYLYLRYRFGIGTVQAQPSADPDTWVGGGELLAEFGESSMDGTIELEEFCAGAALELAPGAEVVPWAEYWRSEMRRR